jgi:hypothetical protein
MANARLNMDHTATGNPAKANDPHVREVVRCAELELRALLQTRAELIKRIGTLKQTISGLATIFGLGILNRELLILLDRKPDKRQNGFTHACRTLLMQSPEPLGAREICRQLQSTHPGLLTHHKDPIASVSTVMNRLVEYKEARRVVDDQSRRRWQWRAELRVEPLPAERQSVKFVAQAD